MSFTQPSLEEIHANGERIGLPARECEKFYAYFDSVGWVVGRSRKPMKSFKGAMATWKLNWQDKQEQGAVISPTTRANIMRDRIKELDGQITYLNGQRPLNAMQATRFQQLKNERSKLSDDLRRFL